MPEKRNGFRITSIIIAIVMVVGSLGIILAVPSTVSAFPTSEPRSDEYLFYDDFETDLANWTTTGTLERSANYASHGAYSVHIIGKPNTANMTRTFGASPNTNVVLESDLYKTIAYNDDFASLWLANASGRIKFGCQQSTPNGVYFSVQDFDRTSVVDKQRTAGWKTFKVYLTTDNHAVFFIDNVMMGSYNITNPTSYGWEMYTIGNWSQDYVDRFIFYEYFMDAIWTRAANSYNIIRTNATWKSTAVAEPSVLYENGTWKMWYRGSNQTFYGLGYATSTDGLSWDVGDNSYDKNLLAGIGPSVFKHGSTYYLYWSTSTAVQLSTSANGIDWSGNTAVLTKGDPGTWDDTTIGNNYVWVEGSQWYMMYDAWGTYWGQPGTWDTGLATSTNGITWTKHPSNPVVTKTWATHDGTFGGPFVTKYGNEYVMLFQYADGGCIPTDIAMKHSTDLIHWYNATFYCQLPHSGWMLESMQTADPFYISQGGQNLLYYCSSDAYNGNISVASSKYSLEDIFNGDVLQWGKQWIGDIGVTNNITGNLGSRTYWYSGINALKGTYFYDWNVTTTTQLNMTILSRTSTYCQWMTDPGSGTPTVSFTLSGLESGKWYRVEVDGETLTNIQASGGSISFTYSGPWSEHEFEVISSFGNVSATESTLLGLVMMFVIVGILLIPVAFIVKTAKEKKKPEIKDFIEIAIIVVIGLGFVGVMWSMLG